jgi:hypothetical protein
VAVVTAWQRNAPAFEYEGHVEVHRLRGIVSRVGMLSADPYRYTPPPFPDPELAYRLRLLIRRFRPRNRPLLRLAQLLRSGRDARFIDSRPAICP